LPRHTSGHNRSLPHRREIPLSAGQSTRTAQHARKRSTANGPSPVPALLLGVGLGGFIDGILLHQVFQWHHMLTSTSSHPMTTVAGLEANTLADGLFHLGTWVCVAAGSAMLHTAWRNGRIALPARAHVGLLLAGWGLFNLLEGLVDHQLLGIHHVRDDLGGPIGWDLAFLALGAALLVGGWSLAGRHVSRSG
jgi:uncharacterized membrane protein